MKEPLRLGDLHTQFAFGFQNFQTQAVLLDPKIGRFELKQKEYFIDREKQNHIDFNETLIEIEESSLIDERLGNFFGRGVYSAKDMNQLSLLGADADPHKQYVELNFIPCLDELDETCADKAEIETFMESHQFFLFSVDIFVKM